MALAGPPSAYHAFTREARDDDSHGLRGDSETAATVYTTAANRGSATTTSSSSIRAKKRSRLRSDLLPEGVAIFQNQSVEIAAASIGFVDHLTEHLER